MPGERVCNGGGCGIGGGRSAAIGSRRRLTFPFALPVEPGLRALMTFSAFRRTLSLNSRRLSVSNSPQFGFAGPAGLSCQPWQTWGPVLGSHSVPRP